MSILENRNRIGSFTSSEIFNLLTEGRTKGTPGKPCIDYIAEKNMERRLGRALTTESNARALTWGKLIEERVFELLPLEYTYCSQDTITHPAIPFWAGSPDGYKSDEGKTVVDIKCPLTLKSFCQLVDPIYNGQTGMDAVNEIRFRHKSGEQYYWQLVSNAILSGAKWAELIVYVPYLSELKSIREMVKSFEGDRNPIAWINFSNDNELPYIIEDIVYSNINIIRFEILQEDKDRLTNAVLNAGKLLKEI